MKNPPKKFLTPGNGFRTVIVFLLLFMPIGFKGNNGIINLLVQCLIYATFGISWNIIAGYGGQSSYCHCAFISIGAYVGAIGFTTFNISPIVTLPLGIALSVAFATFMGQACFRYRGPLFGITTIAFAELLRIALLICDGLTNGARGIMVTYRSSSFLNMQFKTDVPYYYIMLVLLFLCMGISAAFLHSKNGHYLQAIRDDEDAAVSLGIDSNKVKLRAFQLSAAMVTVIGMIYAFFSAYIEPQTICGTDMMIRIAAIGYLGGNNRLSGPVLGAFIMLPIIYFFSSFFTALKATNFFYGLALVIIILFAPDGLIPLGERWFARLKDRVVQRHKTDRHEVII